MITLTGTEQRALTARRNGSIRKNRFAAPHGAPHYASEGGSNIGADRMALLQIRSSQRVGSAQVHQRQIRVVAGCEPSFIGNPKSLGGRGSGQLGDVFERQ